MTCPYCGNEMTPGVICSPRTLAWSPAPLKTFSEGSFHRAENAVLAETGLLSPAQAEAYRCAACRKIVIPYEE